MKTIAQAVLLGLLCVSASVVHGSDVAPDTRVCSGSLVNRDCRADLTSPERGAPGARVLRVPGAPAIERKVVIAPRPQTGGCEARISISYVQMHTVANVEAEVNYSGCPVASGTFLVGVRSANEAGERRLTEYPETWAGERSPVDLEFDYPLNGDVDLISVRAMADRKVGCVCAETESAAVDDVGELNE